MSTLTPAQSWLLYPTWLGYSETLPLPLPRDAYEIEQDGDRWVLRTKANNAQAYRGLGPISLVDEPVPF